MSRGLAFFVLAASMIATFIAWRVTEENVLRRAEAIFHGEVEEAVTAADGRIRTWFNLVNNVRGLYSASVTVEAHEFAAYLDGIDIARNYPDLQAIAYLAGDNFPVVYLQPASADTGVFSYGSADLPRARDERVFAARGIGDHLLIYRAVYRNGFPTTTLEERRRALEGFIVGAFNDHNIFAESIDPDHRSRILLDGGAGGFTETRTIEAANFTWTARFGTTPDFLTFGQLWLPRVVLGAGFVISSLLFGIVRTLGSARDRAQELADEMTRSLRAKEESYRTLVEHIPGAIYRCANDPRWTMEFMSEHIEDITGYPASDFIGNRARSYASIIHPEDVRMVDTIVQDGVRAREPFILEYRIINSKGDIAWVYKKGRGVYDDAGNLRHLDGAIFDITARKRLESELMHAQKLETVGRLAGGIAHDFNNIMVVINFHTQKLEDVLAADDAAKTSLEVIRKNAARATSLTQQLLAFSRRQILDLAPLNLNLFLDETLPMLEPVVGADTAVVVRRAPIAPIVRADHGGLAQALINLAVNARDAMPRGGTLTIETASISYPDGLTHRQEAVPPGSYGVITVADTGIGMTPEEIQHVFEPFFTTKPIGKGTGLGLAMVYGVIRQHEGYVLCDSKKGEGTEFRILIPAAREMIGDSATEPEKKRGAGEVTILVAEDTPEVREVAVQILEAGGYRVLETASGEEALAVSDKHKGAIALLFTDIIMPRVSGAELAENLLRRRPSTKVLYTSGYADDLIVRHGISRTSGIFIPKPYTTQSLLRKVKEILET